VGGGGGGRGGGAKGGANPNNPKTKNGSGENELIIQKKWEKSSATMKPTSTNIKS